MKRALTGHYTNSKSTPHFVYSFFQTTPLTKHSCIFLLQNCKTASHLKQLQAMILQVGLHRDTGVLNKLMALCTASSFVKLSYAERIFDCVVNPSLFLYNVMMKAFVMKGNFGKVIFLFDRLRDQGLWPDNFTYPLVLKAIRCLGDVFLGGQVHGFVMKCGLEFDVYVCNSLMDMYSQLGRIRVAEKLFDEMPDRDVVSWNVLINGFVKCGRFNDAVEVFEQMRKESNVSPSEASVVSTLSACTALKNLELGKDIHRYVIEEIKMTTIIANALLDMYCKCGCLSTARKIFDEMPIKNVFWWTTMVSGYVNHGQLDEARDLFDRSPVRDLVLWTAMINGYVQFNRYDEAVKLFREMQAHKVKPDKFIFVTLLTGCAQLGALDQGKWIHGKINEYGIAVDAVVGTALVEMYARCGCIEKALDIFYGLKQRDTASWTSIICGLAVNGQMSKALDLFSEMERAGVRPDDITLVSVLSACSHGGLIREGQRIFDSMTKKYQIEPKLEHYSCLIDMLGRGGLLGEAEELIENIRDEDHEIAVSLYGSLLSACRLYDNVEMGERLAERLVKMESHNSSIHTLLANIYASADRWEDVVKVRRKMKDLGVKKVPGCSSIEINGVIHEFVVGDPSLPEMKEIYHILDTLSKHHPVQKNMKLT